MAQAPALAPRLDLAAARAAAHLGRPAEAPRPESRPASALPSAPAPRRSAVAGPPPPAAEAAVAQQPDEVIIVTGERREKPLSEATVATEVITRADIESSGATNLADLLARHPGVEVFSSLRGSGVRMQGLDPQYVLVLVDGARAIGRIDGALDLERYAVHNVDRVEIVKGAGSALYGSDALAGTINIITRDVAGPVEATAEARYGSTNALDLSGAVGVRSAAWRARVTGGWRRGDGYDLTPDDIASTASAFDEKQVAARATHTRERGVLSASAEYLRRDLAGVDLGATGAVLDRFSVTETASARVNGRWRPAPGSALARGTGAVIDASIVASLFRDQFLSDQRDGDELDLYEETNETLLTAAAQYQTSLGVAHYVTAGVEAMREGLTSDRLSAPGERYRVAAFAQDEWTASDAPLVAIVPGGRVDVDTQFGVHATPKLAARWDVTSRVIARAGYGWGYRAPSFKELLLRFENPGVGYVVEGNPALSPETSQSATAGVEVRAHDRVWLSGQAFWNDVDDLILIDLVSDSGAGEPTRFGYINVASAYTRGAEAQVQLRPVGGVVLELGYAFTDTRDREAGRQLPGRARHRGTVELGYAHRAWGTEGRVRASLVGTRMFFKDADGDGQDEAVRADPYAAVDVRIAQPVSGRLTVFGGVANLLDAGDARFSPIAPRTFHAGAKASY